jgi:hypothetical protein
VAWVTGGSFASTRTIRPLGKTAINDPGDSGKKLIEIMLTGSHEAKLPSMTQVGISLEI